MDSSIGTYESATPGAPGEPSDAVAAVLGGAVEQARRAIVEFSGETVGAYLGVTFQDEAAATHRFLAVMPGYQGWQWAVVVAAYPGATHATISEVVLVPGPTALLAPAWVPWEQRIRPGDLGPGDLLAPLPDDPRLVPGFVATGDPLIDDTAIELGFGRRRVLSAFGRDTAAQRWHDGDHGPTAAMARATKRVCRDCGFMVPLSGALGGRFGVCCNELSADGEVVDFFYGCGAHSDTPAPHGSGSPAYDPFDDGVLEVVEAPVAASTELEPTVPESAASESTESESADSESMEPEAMESESTGPESAEPESTGPESAEPDPTAES